MFSIKIPKAANCTSSSCLSNMAFTGDGWVAEASNCCKRIIGGCGPSGDMSPRSGDAAAPSSELKKKHARHSFNHNISLLLKVIHWAGWTGYDFYIIKQQTIKIFKAQTQNQPLKNYPLPAFWSLSFISSPLSFKPTRVTSRIPPLVQLLHTLSLGAYSMLQNPFTGHPSSFLALDFPTNSCSDHKLTTVPNVSHGQDDVLFFWCLLTHIA